MDDRQEFSQETELNIIHLLKAKNTFNVRDISNPHPQKKKSDNWIITTRQKYWFAFAACNILTSFINTFNYNNITKLIKKQSHTLHTKTQQTADVRSLIGENVFFFSRKKNTIFVKLNISFLSDQTRYTYI